MSLDSLCRWQVQVSVYCAWRIPAHLRCTQRSILLHLMDICFLTCICLWWGRGGSTQFAQTLQFAVTAPPLVGCVVWSLLGKLITFIHSREIMNSFIEHLSFKVFIFGITFSRIIILMILFPYLNIY